MTLATHALIGSALGKNIHSILPLAAIAIPLHYFLDSFKHGEYIDSMDSRTSFKNSWWKIAIDLCIAISIPFLIFYYKNFSIEDIYYVMVGMFFSSLPDLLTVLYWKFRTKPLEKIYKFHTWCHKYPRISPERKWTLPNALNDILLSLISILILIQ